MGEVLEVALIIMEATEVAEVSTIITVAVSEEAEADLIPEEASIHEAVTIPEEASTLEVSTTITEIPPIPEVGTTMVEEVSTIEAVLTTTWAEILLTTMGATTQLKAVFNQMPTEEDSKIPQLTEEGFKPKPVTLLPPPFQMSMQVPHKTLLELVA